ncbi:MAG: polyamine aminopropyltransferase [Planctomycetota bacterium]
MKGGRWAEEAWEHVVTRYRVRDELYKSRTPFQAMEFVDTEQYGKMLLLDGMVQTTERDEFIYHEMMTHVPLFAHPEPRTVLIIGGGDGGILREALRHPSIERAVLVEIDERVIEFSRKHLPGISQGSFDDPRVEIVVSDGAAYVQKTGETFDVAIVDSSDPIGPATVLFTREFYQQIAAHLNANGILTRQTGSTFMQPKEAGGAIRLARPFFRHCAAYVFAVPTYIGGFFSSLFCSHGVDPLTFGETEGSRRWMALSGRLRYYTPGVHVGAFQLPGYVKENIENGDEAL